jgi:redox-sensitive bicupin YhaK (pirin superfamily)
VYAPTLYVDARFAAGARLVVSDEHAERAIYPIEGDFTVDGEPVAPGNMHVLATGGAVEVRSTNPGRLLICGGAPLDGERLLWWNFVASSQDRIERAKMDWSAQRFGHVSGETEFIPLPDR